MAKRIAANVTISPTPEGQRGPWWCSMRVKVGACDHNPCLEKKNRTHHLVQTTSASYWNYWNLIPKKFSNQGIFQITESCCVLPVLAVPFLPASRPIPPRFRSTSFAWQVLIFSWTPRPSLKAVSANKHCLVNKYSNLVQVYLDYVLTFSQHFNILTNSGSQSRHDS